MFARFFEMTFAAWLLIAPFVLGYPDDAWAYWITDYAAALWIATCACLSFHPRLRRAHLLELIPALWLIGWGWAHPRPVPDVAQHQILTGLLVAMFAILPSWSTRPPAKWVAYYRDREAAP